MKKAAFLFFLFFLPLCSPAIFAQKPKSTPIKKTNLVKPAATIDAGNEKDEFEKAVTQKNATDRIAALRKFIENFPKSSEKPRASELVVSARAEIADEKLRLGDAASGIEFFTLAVRDAPKPVSDKLFTEILLQIPTNLFFRGQQPTAIKVAKAIEEKIEGNANQLLGLATFYLGTENGDEALRLANKALAANPNMPSAYQTLGLAHRLNFELEDAANAYAKALELDSNSTVSKRSLAEMKRAGGKSEEAIALYREILAKDEADTNARTGLALALFDADKKAEAETETAALLAQNPNNLPLLVGAAYWYAAHLDAAKAVELAQKAITAEPRYTWAYIALARGLLVQKNPLEAEKVLLTARQYGNFPTLDYEIASVRLAAGFYREAAEGLKKSFVLKEGLLQTELGGRIPVEAPNFLQLLSLERRASIFEPLAADNPENADKIKSLFDFYQKLESANVDESAVSDTADEFVKGDDQMKANRQIFIAGQLLENKKALPKVLELTKAAIGGVDSALTATNPAAAILAEELYDSRQIAIIRGQLVIVPDVPRQTLQNILRGRIEDISGWTLFQQGKMSEAAVRLKRAVSVLPEKSAWWRNSMWRLGAALDADGKSQDALEAYIKSYINGEPDVTRRSVIESVYQKLNGSLDGLDQKLATTSETASIKATFQPKSAEVVTRKTVREISKEVPIADPLPSSDAKSAPEVKIESRTTAPIPEVKASLEISAPETKPISQPSPDSPREQIAQAETGKKPSPEPQAEIAAAAPPVAELNTERKPTENQSNGTNDVNNSKSLFAPIVITVPNLKTPNPKVRVPINNDKEKSPARKNNAIPERPRVIVEENPNLPAQETAQCKIISSQENISIINNGGNLGILVGFASAGDLKELSALSSSPNDIEVKFEPDIGAQVGRLFFVVKSISANKGIYTVTFSAPCGKKDIAVKVR